MKSFNMKVGTVPYINSLPLYYFLPQNKVIKLFPSELTEALFSGRIDSALLPLYSIIKNNLHMYPEAGLIGCHGAVKSVGLFTRSYIQDLGDIQSIYLDKESLSSVYLTKIILKKFYHVSLYDLEFFHYDNRDMADAQLLIGDKALFSANDKPPYKFWDLGELWKKHTGTGFMFAAWASRRALSAAEITILKDAKIRGLSNIDAIIKDFDDEKKAFIKDYLAQNIIYAPDAQIREGLNLYKNYLKEYHYSEPLELKVA